ncbi:MAG: hypothetical protein WCE62_18820 [Polyangiales bacterium]
MHIRNEHGRRVARPAAEVFGELEAVGTKTDRLWPAPSIPFERTPGPLEVGKTRERHGIIRAVLEELRPGQRLVWRADQPFIKGTHGFEVRETDDGCHVAHVLDADLAWWFAPVWTMKMSEIHDRIVEGLLARLDAHPNR